MKEPTALGHALSLEGNGTPAGNMGQPGADQPLLEAVLGHGLRHPNVVETYKYATRRAEVGFALECLLVRHSVQSSTGVKKCVGWPIQVQGFWGVLSLLHLMQDCISLASVSCEALRPLANLCDSLVDVSHAELYACSICIGATA